MISTTIDDADPPFREVDLAGLKLRVLANNGDAGWYQQRQRFEERVSLLYDFLDREEFELLVDVGANVGLITLTALLKAPRLRALAIEADPRVRTLLRRNIETHLGVDSQRVRVEGAIVGDEELPEAGFSLNPGGTLDNRVNMPTWQQIAVPMRTLDSLLASEDLAEQKVFIKIDTQGFEARVLKGAEKPLASLNNWVMKMEFAPDWLRSQGTDPMELLCYLGERYEIAEFPERIPYGTPSIDALFAHPLRSTEYARFLNYVVSLNDKGLGWVDLIVR
jgi:FkbM family methyltransferase